MSSIQLEDLPAELFENITQYLSLIECVRLERVNSKWRNVMWKEWRRLKIVNIGDLLPKKIIDTLTNNKEAAGNFVDLFLNGIAFRIYPYAESIQDGFPFNSSQIATFLKKLSELSTPELRNSEAEKLRSSETPKLTTLCLEPVVSVDDSKSMTDFANCIPADLNSLSLYFDCDFEDPIEKFCNCFSKRTFAQMESLFIRHIGDSCFKIDVMNYPNLKELRIWTFGDGVIVIDNLHRLKHLEKLLLNICGKRKSSIHLMEALLREDNEFRQSLKDLTLDVYYNDVELVPKLERFSNLESLSLAWENF